MKSNSQRAPHHVAIIMDGNGRWATQQGMPRVMGHQKGAARVREIVEEAASAGVRYLTLFAFSNENWGRPTLEVAALFELLTNYLETEVDHLHKEGIKFSSIGELHRVPRKCQKMLEIAQRKTKDNKKMELVLALSYGARSDLVSACKRLARLSASGEISWQDIDEEMLAANLSTWRLPCPDLTIRTSGEARLSNFLLWESAYTELYFCPVNWPDFSAADFNSALEEYARRERRYGSVASTAKSQHKLGSSIC